MPGHLSPTPPPPHARPRFERRAVRLLVLDPEDRLLLFLDSDLGLDPVAHWWITPGGGVDPGESDLDAAVRELWEETGFVVDPSEVRGPIARRLVVHAYSDQIVTQTEVFHVVRVDGGPVEPGALTDEEILTMAQIRWWTRGELTASGEDRWPRNLLEIWALADDPALWSDGPLDLGTSEESTVPA